ncbi:MAG TPA: hypothetical protein VFB13_03695 [Reyranella sp.]|nr:hypothetical protein [Reyranella sp.]
MGYWGNVHRRAWLDTAKAVGLEGERFWVFLVLQLVVAIAIYAGLGEAGLEKAAPSRVVATAAPFLAFPIVYALKFIKALPALAAADRANIDDLQEQLNAKPKPPSQETWINPHDAYVLACRLRGLDAKSDPTGDRRYQIFEDFRQFAADDELKIRGRPVDGGGSFFIAPLEFVPSEHWRRFGFKEGAYIANDGDVSEVTTEDSLPYGPSIGPRQHPYSDLYLRKSDVERLFKL